MSMGAHSKTGRAEALPVALLEQAISQLSRSELAGLTERLIDRLDELDPDPDLEPNGDELDGTGAEDEALLEPCRDQRPGCPISDIPEDDDEDFCTSSDDRGSRGPNARFPGYSQHKEIEADADCEFWRQHATLNWKAALSR